MGCDIHLYVERKRNVHRIEKWVNIDHFKLNSYFDNDKCDGEKQLDVISLYNDRNYELFANLADVRNRHGNIVIAPPKGLPDDCSDIVSEESESWGDDGHSHSYFTLKELKEFYSKHGTVKHRGLMTQGNADMVDRGEMPHSWCQGTNISDYVEREWEWENEGLKKLIDKLEERKKEGFNIWGDDEHPEYDDKIRIVFWFDN